VHADNRVREAIDGLALPATEALGCGQFDCHRPA
jgi:hypothetical protein